MCSPLVHVCAIGDAARANPYDILKNVETSPSSLVRFGLRWSLTFIALSVLKLVAVAVLVVISHYSQALTS